MIYALNIADIDWGFSPLIGKFKLVIHLPEICNSDRKEAFQSLQKRMETKLDSACQ